MGSEWHANNQCLNTLSAFQVIRSPRCHSVRSTHGDNSHRTNCEGFLCKNTGRLNCGAADEQGPVVELKKTKKQKKRTLMNSWRGPGCFLTLVYCQRLNICVHYILLTAFHPVGRKRGHGNRTPSVVHNRFFCISRAGQGQLYFPPVENVS